MAMACTTGNRAGSKLPREIRTTAPAGRRSAVTVVTSQDNYIMVGYQNIITSPDMRGVTPLRTTGARPPGRPRNPDLDGAILAAAEQQLGELGYARMSLESVAAAAGTTVPSVRRRFGSKAALAEAVIRSLRVAELPAQAGPPRARALAILEN